MAKKFDSDALKKAGEEWDKHHEIVAVVRRLVRLTGGVQEAKDAIDGIDLVQTRNRPFPNELRGE